MDTRQLKFGRDYFVGDKVTVAVDGEEYTDVVREVNLSVEDGGRVSAVTPKIGDQGTGSPLNLYNTVFEMREKLRKLEARM
ncbi:Gp37-like protein [Streptomyces klenkii]